jgi:2-amino-4-hydroxy-6-hydroxymethyldihydropteridine diphosphokinase
MGEQVYLLLGSNEGDREGFLQEALGELERRVASGPMSVSGIYETAAWGMEEQPSFLNMAVGMRTALIPHEILSVIRDVEARLGRQRVVVWGQRTLDVDVLLYGDEIIQTEELHIPHPRLGERRFALAPLAEIASGVVHPITGQTIQQMLDACPDLLPVRLFR